MSTTPDEQLPLPTVAPVTVGAVKGRLNITDNADDGDLADIVDAVDVLVRRLPVSDSCRGLEDWPADISLGARMLAGRLFRRRKTPEGVVTFGAEGAVYVQRNDPDIAQLLQLGDWAKPTVG